MLIERVFGDWNCRKVDCPQLWNQRSCLTVSMELRGLLKWLRRFGLKCSSTLLKTMSCSKGSSSSQAWLPLELSARKGPLPNKLLTTPSSSSRGESPLLSPESWQVSFTITSWIQYFMLYKLQTDVFPRILTYIYLWHWIPFPTHDQSYSRAMGFVCVETLTTSCGLVWIGIRARKLFGHNGSVTQNDAALMLRFEIMDPYPNRELCVNSPDASCGLEWIGLANNFRWQRIRTMISEWLFGYIMSPNSRCL